MRNLICRISAVFIAILLIFDAGIMVNAETLVPIGDEKAKAPEIVAHGAMLYSCDLEKPVYSKNADKRYYPYSMTKLMTAYLTVKNADLDKVVTVSADAENDIENGTTMYLWEGEKISVEELLYGMLMVSANDAAYALGEATAGSMKAFVEMMNEQAREWGCSNTHFTNSVGLKDADHYTTANDLLIIVQHVFADETIRKILTTEKHTVPATNMSSERKLKNYVLEMNKKNPGVLGGKSGTWDDDDAGFALMYEKDSLSAILILLKSGRESRVDDARKMFRYAHKVTPGFEVKQGDELSETWVKHGEKTRVATELAETVRAYPKENEASAVTTETLFDELEAPLAKGDIIGTYAVYANGEKVAESDVLAAENVAEGWFPSYIYISNLASCIILAGILLIIILLLCYNHRVAKKDEYRGKH